VKVSVFILDLSNPMLELLNFVVKASFFRLQLLDSIKRFLLIVSLLLIRMSLRFYVSCQNTDLVLVGLHLFLLSLEHLLKFYQNLNVVVADSLLFGTLRESKSFLSCLHLELHVFLLLSRRHSDDLQILLVFSLQSSDLISELVDFDLVLNVNLGDSEALSGESIVAGS